VAQRIQEYWLKIKGVLDQGLGEWGIFAIVVLVGLISFGLGRLSALEEAKPPISVQMAPPLDSPQGTYMGGLIIASKSGNSYYFPWCSGAEKIAAANKVWFDSETEAKAAGYAPAKNCKGLGTGISQ